jgi:RHS repeat-associated protein
LGSQSAAPSQIIALPKGGGAQQGLGETFTPDLHTGTGNFAVPITLPQGRNGFQPDLRLVYSTGSGNGPFGLGWSLSVPQIARKTAKGIPRYRDDDRDLTQRDTFVLSGAEDLARIVDGTLDATTTRYRPRTEGLFAKILRHRVHPGATDYWKVLTKDGLTSLYGTPPPDPRPTGWVDPVVIRAPAVDNPSAPRIFAWNLSATTDAFGNRIEYLYEQQDKSTERDEQLGRCWNQPLLTSIRYGDYASLTGTEFLVSVDFEYEDRPDPTSGFRAGFEIRSTKRCRAITIRSHADLSRAVRRYDLTYKNDSLNRISLLTAIVVVGFDDAGHESRELPPLEFGYSDFDPQNRDRRDFYPIRGPDLPPTSLAGASMELVDLFGSGLPDILEMGNAVRYWRNRGGGRYDLPRPMRDAPAGISLANPGVQLIDADGDGRTDLMVSDGPLGGYYSLQFGGTWDRRSFHKYAFVPSFDLKDPEVRLLDLTGDGVTDALRSSTRLECYFNDPRNGWRETRWVERKSDLAEFPNVTFADPRVRFADLTGDGMQDVVLVYDGNVDYWPNLGYGNWGTRRRMRNSPRFPLGYDMKRVLLGDIDGDGLADLIYVDDRQITLWINQGGNAWSAPVVIDGTPPVSDMDGVRITDLLGSGVAGLLWTRDATGRRQDHYFFLDLTGGTKPYCLTTMSNNMGALTRVTYGTSTSFYLEDEKRRATRWRTPLPFPVQVVARVEIVDELSRATFTTEYRYHHGYWDGIDREFRGFGMVEHFDTQRFALDQNRSARWSPPTLTKTWFHQGPVGEGHGEWAELDWSADYWTGDPPLLSHTEMVGAFLKRIDGLYQTLSTRARRAIKRDALRSLRGSQLRAELYALDGSHVQERPYTVIEHAYGLREIEPPQAVEADRTHIFLPYTAAQRTTQWERGDDPMTQFSFTGEPDIFGRTRNQTAVAVPRRAAKRSPVRDETHLLTTHTRIGYAAPAGQAYIHDRTAFTTSFERLQSPTVLETDADDVSAVLRDQRDAALRVRDTDAAVFDGWEPGQPIPNAYRAFAHVVNRFDGEAYTGLSVGVLGDWGAATLSESLAFTDDILDRAYSTQSAIAADGSFVPPSGLPAALSTDIGYRRVTAEAGYVAGYYLRTLQQQFDCQDTNADRRVGLVLGRKDPRGAETRITYDRYGVLAEAVEDPLKLATRAVNNYRVLKAESVTDPNDNVSEVRFSPSGLVVESWSKGKLARNEGDRLRPGVRIEYDFQAFVRSKRADPSRPQPVSVRTVRQVYHDTDLGDTGDAIEVREYSDGFGRLLQRRSQAEQVRFGDETFGGGDEVLAPDQDVRGGTIIARRNTDAARPNVLVDGWKIYDNKGRVVEKYEPFFDIGWDFDPPDDGQLGARVVTYYDPRGQIIRTLNADGSEVRVIYGIPVSLADPPLGPDEVGKFSPTSWEAFTYETNDLAPISFDPEETLADGSPRPLTEEAPRHHHFTPSSVLTDALGRVLVAIERTRAAPSSQTAALAPLQDRVTRSTFDIRGDVVRVTDPLGRVAVSQVYDCLRRVLRRDSIDSGTRRVVLDAAGSEVMRRDSKGALTAHEYDTAGRPVRVWARDRTNQTIGLRERLTYGDGSDPGQPAAERSAARVANTLGHIVRHDDEAGRVTLGPYDFRGNVLETTRLVISDQEVLSVFPSTATNWSITPYRVNWSPGSEPQLDAFQYRITLGFDALNRITRVQYPQAVDNTRSLATFRYNAAGALESMDLNGMPYIREMAHDAQGQRSFIAYGNGVMTRFAYDRHSFRPVRIRTEHYLRTGNGNYRPTGAVLQDLGYEYDLAGNITAIHDRAPGCGIPSSPDRLDRSFTYDPLYRLVTSTGRQCSVLPSAPWDDRPRCQAASQTRRYEETYDYDAAGNMTDVSHVSGAGGSYSRHSTLQSDTNLLGRATIGQTTYTCMYDLCGNLTSEGTERSHQWDHLDRLKSFRTQAGTSEPSVYAQYLYDASGQRTMKVVRKQGGEQEVTIYVGRYFEHFRWTRPGQTQQSNNRLHLLDNQRRVGIIRVGAPLAGDTGPREQYHLADHVGSHAVTVDGDGVWINREEYLPYGETSFGSFSRKRYRFSGQERDEESGLSYFGARYYATWLSRWASPDPNEQLEAGQPLNRFVYALNNPLRYVDPVGTQEDEESRFPAQRPPELPKGTYFVSSAQVDAAKVNGATSQAAKGNDPLTGRTYAPPPVVMPLYDRVLIWTADNICRPALIILMTSPGLVEWGVARTVAASTEAEFAVGAGVRGISPQLQAQLDAIPAVPAAELPVASPRILLAEVHDTVAFNAAVSMAKTTGQPVRALTTNAAAGASEATLVGHGVHHVGENFASFVRVGGQDYTAKELAKYLVNEAKWSGGTLRMATCQTGVVSQGGTAYAQDLSAYLELLGAPTTVISPKGAVAIPSAGVNAGLPLVEGAAGWLAPSKGWTYH